MADPTAKLLLEIVNAYENTPRALLAHNARRAMEPLKLTERQQYLWIADLCGTGRDSTYFWFAPNRESKIPLRVVARMAAALDVSPFVFSELLAEPPEIQLRRKRPRKVGQGDGSGSWRRPANGTPPSHEHQSTEK